jgi:hypothetical protein
VKRCTRPAGASTAPESPADAPRESRTAAHDVQSKKIKLSASVVLGARSQTRQVRHVTCDRRTLFSIVNQKPSQCKPFSTIVSERTTHDVAPTMPYWGRRATFAIHTRTRDAARLVVA